MTVMQMTICKKCGALFLRKSTLQDLCSNCNVVKRIAHPYKCQIVECQGRCEGHIKEICELCFEYCVAHGWIGWKAVGPEWWEKENLDATYTSCHSDSYL